MIKLKQVPIALINSFNKNTLMEVLEIECIELGEDYLKSRMPVKSSTHQPTGLLHGGASMALIESVGSMGSVLLIDYEKEVPVGVEINANHIYGVKDGFVVATGTIVHAGKRTHVWKVDIVHQLGLYGSSNRYDCTKMKQTKLRYRFPGKNVVEKIGYFTQIDDPNEFEGFIVSDFYGKKIYGFIEDKQLTEQNCEQQVPIFEDHDDYIKRATLFRERIKEQQIGKAILSRIKRISISEIQYTNLFDKLIVHYPQAFCYSFQSPMLGEWIGASPEILAKFKQEQGQTMALAGTIFKASGKGWKPKEKKEQKLVAEFIKNKLEKYDPNLVQYPREELSSGPVTHLLNRFTFSVPIEQQWALILNLHPTPAVSGFPREKALECIDFFEVHKRKLYAGIIGYTSKNKKKLYVNLRCAQRINDFLYLYVGGGFTNKSIPENEWEETEKKAETLISLIE